MANVNKFDRLTKMYFKDKKNHQRIRPDKGVVWKSQFESQTADWDDLIDLATSYGGNVKGSEIGQNWWCVIREVILLMNPLCPTEIVLYRLQRKDGITIKVPRLWIEKENFCEYQSNDDSRVESKSNNKRVELFFLFKV